jgi:M6 family metalloprotease-like protein
MMKKNLVFFLIMICLGSLSAQTFIRKINAHQNNYTTKITGTSDTLKILAVMVEFQTDQDAATEGNGKFGTIYSKDYGTNIVDPLPHDQSYFGNHLEFVKNYFEKVSNGKLAVKYYVLPVVFTVSQRMRNYSTSGSDFTALADFSKEVWAKADSAYPDFDFNDYNLFTIFHAGVGKEVSLSGSVSDSKDISSLYLSKTTLDGVFGASFRGFPMKNSSFYITNSLVMPETESREETLTDGSVALAQITINGLMASSIGNYLGLPDLYNTTTGVSAIGRFGLMDTQSIFAYNGVFPPEPSAWEKIFLGWATPVTLSPGNYSLNLAARMAASQSDTTVLKVPINSSEYFLIENRQRDVNSDGATITYVLNGVTYTKTFTKDNTGFTSIDIDSLKGVITNVDEFDWAIPGIIDDTAHYHGGILIWHIDDNVINSKIATDQINADASRRGVNLMEASGIPEIGEKFTTVLGDIVIGEGTYEDYWYSSNPAELFSNRFADDTRPSSNTNEGANSLISISKFSDSGNKMSFKITYGDSLVKPLFVKKISQVSSDNKLTAGIGSSFSVISGQNLILLDNSGDSTGILNNFSSFKTAVMYGATTQYVFGAYDSTLNIYRKDNTVSSSGALSRINIGDAATSAPVVVYKNSIPEILIGTQNGYVKSFSLDSGADMVTVDSASNGYGVTTLAAYNDYYAFGGTINVMHAAGSNSQQSYGYFINDNLRNKYSSAGSLIQIALTNDKNGNKEIVALLSGNTFDIISSGKLVDEFKINSIDSIKSFALADLKQDGNVYIVFNNGNNVEAVNMQGSEADNFPFTDPQRLGFTGNPLTADITGDNKSEIIAATIDGRIFAVNGVTGKVVTGFPISSGAELSGTPALYKYNGSLSLAAYNKQGTFAAWSICSGEGKTFWQEENGNNNNSSYVGAAVSQNIINTFFPANKAYNYPNPVYSGVTRIHYYVSEDSKIDIKIFDVAGDYVAGLTDNAQGGLEKETQWSIGNIQSGIYFASIKATSVSGKVETNIIKIAVIK